MSVRDACARGPLKVRGHRRVSLLPRILGDCLLEPRTVASISVYVPICSPRIVRHEGLRQAVTVRYAATPMSATPPNLVSIGVARASGRMARMLPDASPISRRGTPFPSP